jgi:hypothetical protein
MKGEERKGKERKLILPVLHRIYLPFFEHKSTNYPESV